MVAIPRPLRGARRGLPVRTPFGTLNWWVMSAVLIAGTSAMLPVFQNSMATSEGFHMQSAQAEQAQLRGDISVLESDVGQLTSLERIQRRAQEIGLSPSDNPIFVHVDEAGPAPAKIPAEYLPAPTPQRVAPQSWWQSFFGWLPVPH